MTSITAQLSLDGVPVDTTTWIGNLEFLNVVELSFSEVTLESGAYDLTASLLSVNGASDDNPSNNELQTAFVLNATDNAGDVGCGGGVGMRKLDGRLNSTELSWRKVERGHMTYASQRDATSST